MNHLFVTYEIALKLKELGFDEPCFGVFITEGLYIVPKIPFKYESFTNDTSSWVSAPLYQQAVDWLNKNPNLPLFKDHVIYDSNKELSEERILRAIKKIQSVN